MTPEKISRITEKRNGRIGKEHIRKYTELVLESGAAAAEGIEVRNIPVDPRVALKCSIPKCFGYGTSAHCPPHCMKPEETQRIIDLYSAAVVFSLEVPPEVIVRDKDTILERVGAYKKVFELVSLLESAAFYDGYYLAAGFAAGSCKSTYCYNVSCTVLQGEKCRLSLRSRPSMEAVSIDCYKLATDLGWEIYPIGSDAPACSFPFGRLMGMVLID